MTRWSSFDNSVFNMVLIITYEDRVNEFCPSHLPTSCVPIQIWWSFNIYIVVWWSSYYIILIIRTEGLDGMFESQFTCCLTHFCTKYDICDTAAAEETAEKKTELWRSIVSIELELECTCTEIFSTQNRFGSLVFQWKDLFPTEFVIFRILISRSKVEFLAFSVI